MELYMRRNKTIQNKKHLREKSTIYLHGNKRNVKVKHKKIIIIIIIINILIVLSFISIKLSMREDEAVENVTKKVSFEEDNTIPQTISNQNSSTNTNNSTNCENEISEKITPEIAVENYNTEIQCINSNIRVKVNADINNYNEDSAQILTASPTNISKEEFENFADVVTQGAKLYIYDPYDKGEKDKLYTGALGEKKDNLLYTTITHLKAKVENNKTALITFYQSRTQAESKILFQNFNNEYEYNKFIVYDGIAAKNISISYEEALNRSWDIVRNIDTKGNLVLASTMIAYSTDNGLTRDTSPNAYNFIFTRTYNELLELPLMSLPDPKMNEENFQLITNEYLEIRIDDFGIEYCTWVSPCTIESYDNYTGKLLEFPKVSEIFESYCKDDLEYYGPNSDELILNVSRIELNYITIPKAEDYQTLEVIPVWDFILSDPPLVYINNKNNFVPEEGKDVSIITINAIDGSVINRNPRVLYKTIS